MNQTKTVHRKTEVRTKSVSTICPRDLLFKFQKSAFTWRKIVGLGPWRGRHREDDSQTASILLGFAYHRMDIHYHTYTVRANARNTS